MAGERYEWSIAVFGMNEARTIGPCLLALQAAASGRRTHISVLLNGTTDNSAEIVDGLAMDANIRLEALTFPKADKSDAINRVIHGLRPDAGMFFFVDAYTRVGPQALQAMATEMARNPHALIVTGVPVNGRSSAQTIRATVRGGVINGQLYALRRSFMEAITARGLRLPLGIYRGDGLIGSMACHNLDPINNKWDDKRIAGLADAPFEISPLSVWRPADVRRQFNREIRQARGRFENEAIKTLIGTGGYEALPADADDMILGFLARTHVAPRSLKEHIFMRLALRRIHRARSAPGNRRSRETLGSA